MSHLPFVLHVQFAPRGTSPPQTRSCQLAAKRKPSATHSRTRQQRAHRRVKAKGIGAGHSAGSHCGLPGDSMSSPFCPRRPLSKKAFLASSAVAAGFVVASEMSQNTTPPRASGKGLFPDKRKAIHKGTLHLLASLPFLPLDRSLEVMRRGAMAPTITTIATLTSLLF